MIELDLAIFFNQRKLAMQSINFATSTVCISTIISTLLIAPVGLAVAAEAGVLEEVIVTARKREESLQDIPISVQTFSGEAIAEQGIVALQDLAPYTPSFSYVKAAGASDLYFMRGIGTFGSGVHFEPGVGQVFNGFFSTRGRLGRSALIDVAQVETVHGCQDMPGLDTECARFTAVKMATDHEIYPRIFQYPCLNHGLCPTRTFFSRLEKKFNVTPQVRF